MARSALLTHLPDMIDLTSDISPASISAQPRRSHPLQRPYQSYSDNCLHINDRAPKLIVASILHPRPPWLRSTSLDITVSAFCSTGLRSAQTCIPATTTGAAYYLRIA